MRIIELEIVVIFQYLFGDVTGTPPYKRMPQKERAYRSLSLVDFNRLVGG